MKEYYRPLKNLPEITDPTKLSKYQGMVYSGFNINDVNPEIISLFDKLGLILQRVQVFHKKPSNDKVWAIHTDSTVSGEDFAKVNWVYGGQGSLMKWYKQKPNISKTTSSFPHGPGVMLYTEDEVELVYSTELPSPSIVQVGIPHDVVNPLEERYCISIIPFSKETNNRISIDQLSKIFKDYLV